MDRVGGELILVPHGGLIQSEGETEVTTQYLVDFIDANTVTIYEDEKTVDDDLVDGE